MKIQEVTIEGYQSHTNSTFRLSPGLTVITGPSDAGKTAIIRALRWFAFNEPTGEAFLHTIRNPDGSIKEAVDQVKVSVTFDNGITITKTRRKGKTTYTHSAFPTAWEKAEIPPEIKETLGLVKQQYGDFETCLNFAFQLDAPFMLSESASVGAKVLGKLAGTEIVDKSISEVNKKTHQTRNDISYADKQIGEIDVSLTEYFDLDRFDAELKIAEAAFTKLKEDQSRHDALTALMNSYQLNTEQRIKYYDEVERLAGVVVASVSLGIAEREQAKKEKLEDLNVGFWKAVQDQNEPLRVIRITRNLEDLQSDLKEVETDVIRYDALTALMNSYQLNTEQRIKYYDEVERLAGVVVASVSLGIAEREQAKKEKLEDLNVGFWKAVQDQNEPLRVIRITRNLEDLQSDLKEVETDVIRYDALLGFQYGYINLQETIRRTSALVVKLDQAVGLSFMLDEAEKDTQALEALERAYKRFNEVSEEERDLRYKVSSLGNTEALADILGSISKQYDELDNLKRLNVVSQTRQLSYEAAGRYVEKCNRELEEAQEELQAAWEAAGGVCPLCGSEVKENCTH